MRIVRFKFAISPYSLWDCRRMCIAPIWLKWNFCRWLILVHFPSVQLAMDNIRRIRSQTNPATVVTNAITIVILDDSSLSIARAISSSIIAVRILFQATCIGPSLVSVCIGFKVLDIPSRTSLQLSNAFRAGSIFPALSFLTGIVLSTSTRITRSVWSCALRSDISFGASAMLLMRLMSADVVFTATEATPTAPDVTPNISAILIGVGLRCV